MAHESPRRHAASTSDASSTHPLPPPYFAASSPQPIPGAHRKRGSIQLPPDGIFQPQPIKEAVNSAFGKSNMSTNVPADLVQHITEQVLQNLRLSGIAPQGQAAGTPQPPPPQMPSSNSTASSIPPRDIRTPPSPVRDTGSNIGSTTSDPLDHPLEGFDERVTGASRHTDRVSPQRGEGQSRPPPPAREGTGNATTLEKIWQPLFDSEGRPTERLGQFLRGLAVHIIEDYEPSNSIVITPQKMVRFYEDTKLPNESYPWNAIFGGKMSNSSISHLYRDLSCQHHFVQRQFDEKPNIPALTPLGFECWMTQVIRSSPGEEFERCAKAAMNMPISNADNRKERFPKQLSRRLFPKQPNTSVREHLEDSILADPNIELPKKRPAQASSNLPPPPSQQAQPSQSMNPVLPPNNAAKPPAPPHQASTSSIEKERQSFSAAAPEAVTEELGPSVSIERERKPYHAQPGSGKVYDQDDPRAVKSDAGIHRSNTTSSRARPNLEPPEDPNRQSRHYRSGSQSVSQQSRPKPRQRSSSLNARSNPYTLSEGDMPPQACGNQPSNLRDDGEYELSKQQSREHELTRNATRDERARRYQPEDAQRGSTTSQRNGYEDDKAQRGYGSSGRNGYEEDYHRRGPPAANGYPPSNGYANYQYPQSQGQGPPSQGPGRYG